VHPPLACKIAQRRDIENLSARIAIERQLVRKWGGCNRPIAWREISKKPCGVISLQMGNPHWLCFLRQAADDDPKQVPVASSVEPARNAIVEFVSSQVSLATDAKEHIAGTCAHAIGKARASHRLPRKCGVPWRVGCKVSAAVCVSKVHRARLPDESSTRVGPNTDFRRANGRFVGI